MRGESSTRAGVTTSGAWIEYLGGEMPLAPGDVYQFESYTAAPLRGRGIAAARVSAMADQLAREGHRRLIACVLPENAAAFRPLEKAGYRAVGRISALGGGPWRRLRLRLAASPTDYWGQVHRRMQTGSSIPVWRAYMRQVYADLIHRWLPESSPGMALKTDLFEEAVGSARAVLRARPAARSGIDLAPAIVKAAGERLASAGGKQHFVVGDLRQVPLRSGSITRIFGTSSIISRTRPTSAGASPSSCGCSPPAESWPSPWTIPRTRWCGCGTISRFAG